MRNQVWQLGEESGFDILKGGNDWLLAPEPLAPTKEEDPDF